MGGGRLQKSSEVFNVISGFGAKSSVAVSSGHQQSASGTRVAVGRPGVRGVELEFKISWKACM